MNNFKTLFLTLFSAILFSGCVKEIPQSEFIAYYDSHCRADFVRSGMKFMALSLNEDYEKVKWGNSLGLGKRVLFWVEPYTGISFKDAFLVDGKDSVSAVSLRKVETFELKTIDSFVISFSENWNDAVLLIKNVGNGIGNIEMDLKNCSNIRLARE